MKLSIRHRPRLAVVLVCAVATAGLSGQAPVHAVAAGPPDDDTPVLLTPKGEHEDEAEEQGFDKLRDAYYWSRLLAGDEELSLRQAARLRSRAAQEVDSFTTAAPFAAAKGGAWTGQGPSPIVQVGRTTNTFEAVTGRIGALVIRNDGTIILGAAQGGVWTYDSATKTWTPRTDDSETQSVGSLAIAPSDDSIVYMGSGEGALSGDSYYGDGIYRSADGGLTWRHVSTKFAGQAVSEIVVDPTKPSHLYAATVRGRGGNHRTSAPTGAAYGVYESSDSGQTWNLRKGTTSELHGATDLVMDPQNPKLLWASFWGDGIYKTTDGGTTWTSALGDLPAGNFLEGGTRFSLGISHKAGAARPVLYTGFDYFDQSDTYHEARVFKSTDNGTHWTPTALGSGIDTIEGYCGTQCFYDNEVRPDPTNPKIVYVLGSYGYDFSPASGGVFRSTDGGATWKNLGNDLHPDFHAFAFQPHDTRHVAIGNDGGVWQSHRRGGRNGTGGLSTVDWENLNGEVDPSTGALLHSTGLAITQFSSIATVPQVPGQFWGGTQDNGTLRKSLANNRWFDQASGDGGQVIVDQSTLNPVNPSAAAFVFGTYFDISPYRYDPTEVSTFFGNEAIDGGIDLSDRSEFYVPWVQNRGNVNQLFLGTYRLYRTDNAETPSAADVTWAPISPDLTSGCEGPAPNGARGCLISAIGVADGGDGVYVGTDEGLISTSPDAVTSDAPTWRSAPRSVLPNRPVNQFAVDRSNWRIAYAAYGGFDQATPTRVGHVFATSDGGRTWSNITGNLPDVPVDSVVLDPSDAKTLYVGTDVGPFVTSDGGATWQALGAGMPKVAVWQLDYDAANGVLLAGTHGRGAYTQNLAARPALVVSKADSGTPVGPGSTIDYTITVRNIGKADATSVRVSDPIPRKTSFVSAADGGKLVDGAVQWSGLTVPAGGTKELHFAVKVAPGLDPATPSITNDGILVASSGGFRTTGSPHTTAIAQPNAVSVTPTSAREGGAAGDFATYTETITNDGYRTDAYALSATGPWATTVYDATCTTPLTTTAPIAAGASADVCVKVKVPAGAPEAAARTSTVTATSTTDGGVSASATLTTLAVAVDTLLVDNDTNDPVDSAPFYAAALTANGVDFGTWDLGADPALPDSFLALHHTVVWFTGNSYPAPISPYERGLQALLDNGGRLLMSGQDILDQAAGTTDFVHDYLHIDWDGSEAQNDKATSAVHGVTGNPVTDGIGAVPIDHSVLDSAFEDEVTPIAPATPAFTDDASETDALSVADDGYKVVFLGFPLEAYGTATQRADLVGRALDWFGS